jgi:HK97 family phage prohead protease
MKGLLEFKGMGLELKDVDTVSRKVSGYWSAFGNKDYDRDVIMQGAFRKTISERGPKGTNEIFFLNQHNWAQPMGRPDVLMEDTKGLYFEAPIVKTSYGDDALVLYAEKLVEQHSIGFVTMKEAWVKPNGEWDDETYREISEVKLYEGSCVTLGANSQTPFTGFKAKSLAENESMVGKIVKLLRNGNLTDETFIQLEIALKQLQKEAFEIGKESLKVQPSEQDTEKNRKPIDIEKAFETYLFN